MQVFDHTLWSSTCLLLEAVLTEAYSYRPGELSSGVRMRFVPSLADLSCLLCELCSPESPKGKMATTSRVVDSEERQMTATLHRLMGSVARCL